MAGIEPAGARRLTRGVAVLGLFALAGAALIALTVDLTRERIAANEKQAALATLHQILPADAYDNDLLDDRIDVVAAELLGTREPVGVFRARRDGRPVGVVLQGVVAPGGYSGAIRLMVGIRSDATLAGVRVLAHRETPGLGDAIDIERSDWIRQFENRSSRAPPPAGWAVGRDGGEFDALTGATITSRAVVKGVYGALLYFDGHRDALFSTASGETLIE